MKKQLLVLTGPTAVGKTALAIEVANYFNTEILSCDSRQFYREMKIGTAAPTQEELAAATHHFIGHLSIHDNYNVSQYEEDALKQLESSFEKQDVVILTGGSGLYIDAVCKGIDKLPDPDPQMRLALNQLAKEHGISALQKRLKELDPEYYAQVDKLNPVRLERAIEVCLTTGEKYSALRKQNLKERPFDIHFIGLNRERDLLFNRIHQRIDLMLASGLLEEVNELYPLRHLNALKTVGYREFFEWKEGLVSFEQAVENLKTNSRRYAKRQLTWFKKNQQFHWFHADEKEKIMAAIKCKIN